MLDLGLQKGVSIGNNDRYKLKLMLDLFNVFNTNEILLYSDNNISLPAAAAPSSIIPPRVLRFGIRATF